MRSRALVVAIIATACRQAPKAELAGNLTATALPAARPRPSFTLTSLDGTPFDFGARTRGRLTLLFFGYTNCPDVCPATMANIGAATSRMTSGERGQLDVVFVSTDRERDSPARIRDWLRQFDAGIIGLTGTEGELEAAQRAAGVGIARRDSSAGSYTVSHAAQVLVYSADDSSHVTYPFGTRQAEWAADLPKLLSRWSGR